MNYGQLFSGGELWKVESQLRVEGKYLSYRKKMKKAIAEALGNLKAMKNESTVSFLPQTKTWKLFRS